MSDKMTGLKIAYIGGGSRGWAWALMSDLASEGALGGDVALYDIDREAASANEIIGNRMSALPEAAGKWKYRASDTLADALRGADFVIISILPGTFDEMHSDVHEPEKYGIYQSVGDTAGPGGLVRALRAIPMFQAIAEAIGEHAPNACVINYTNPMAVCLRALYEMFPGIKAFGCCHEVFGTQALLADMLCDMLGAEGATRGDISINVMGLNHFTWITRATWKGMDLFPLYRQFVDKYYESGFMRGGGHWIYDMFSSANRVKFDLFRRYGHIAAAGDRHLAEFCPPWYLKNPETVRKWMFGLTTVDWRKEDMQRRLKRSKDLVSGAEEVQITHSGEEGVLLMKALLGMGNVVSNVNLPNRGQIANLPYGTVVETNALFACGRVTPLLEGDLPAGVLELTVPHALNQRMILEAGMHGDYDLAFKAFLNEPLVALLPDEAEKLFKAMLKNTARFLRFPLPM